MRRWIRAAVVAAAVVAAPVAVISACQASPNGCYEQDDDD